MLRGIWGTPGGHLGTIWSLFLPHTSPYAHRSINWAKLERRELESKFKPAVSSRTCTANFDKLWTDQPPEDSPCNSPQHGSSDPCGDFFKASGRLRCRLLHSLLPVYLPACHTLPACLPAFGPKQARTPVGKGRTRCRPRTSGGHSVSRVRLAGAHACAACYVSLSVTESAK